MKSQMIKLFFINCILITTTISAQTGNVGIGTATPSAKLHVNGDLRIDSLALTSDANQMLVLDTVTQKVARAPFSVNIIGDIKFGIQTGDHSNWILLDGRAIGSLTPAQQASAASLGFFTNIPNATNSVLVQNGAALGSVSGSNAKTIAQANLPNATLTGTTVSAGAHSHSNNSSGALGGYGLINRSAGGSNTTTGADATTGEPNVVAAPIALTINSDGAHTHTFTTSSINGGVTQTTLDVTPRSLSVNTFIYLGN